MAGIAASSWASDAAGPDYLTVKDLTPVKVLATPQHSPVVLVADGRSKGKIYLAVAKPSATLDILVKELVGTVKMSTGAELEIVKEVPTSDVPAIVIGDCAASRGRHRRGRRPCRGLCCQDRAQSRVPGGQHGQVAGGRRL